MHDAQNNAAQLQACIKLMHAGDPSARDQLIQHSCERLQQLTRGMLHKYADVRRWEQTEDIYQNSMIRFYRTLDTAKIESPRDFFALATTVIRSELIDLARHYYGPEGLGRHHETVGPDTSRHPAHESIDEPGDITEWSEFHQRVGELPEEEREVMNLIYYQGLSQKEAAELLNVSERTIKRRWQSARLLLHRAVTAAA